MVTLHKGTSLPYIILYRSTCMSPGYTDVMIIKACILSQFYWTWRHSRTRLNWFKKVVIEGIPFFNVIQNTSQSSLRCDNEWSLRFKWLWPCHIWPDQPYVQETNIIRQCSCYFDVLLLSAKCVRVRQCSLQKIKIYIPGVRRTFSAGLVLSSPDNIFLYTAIRIGPIWPSVTGPLP